MRLDHLPAQADLVIVGGGMVGITLALCLARQLPDRQVLLLESMTFPPIQPGQPLSYVSSFDARNTALSRRTIQLFQDLGLWPALQPHATPIHEIHVSDRGRFGFARLQAAEEQVESFGQVVENAWLGVVLLEALRRCPSVTVVDGVEVTGLAVTATTARVDCCFGDERRQVSTPLVVAADGTQSRTRDWLGLGAHWRDYGQTALVTTVATSLPHAQRAFERFTAEGPIALLPLPDGPDLAPQTRRSLVWALSTERADEVSALDDEAFLAALQAAFGRRAGRFTRVGRRHAYPLQLMVAHRQSTPRALILGNAAHSLHPVAGQGFNLCVRDVLVLVSRLAAQTADWGDAAFLQAYEDARQADQQQIIRFSDLLVRGFSSDWQPWASLRSLGLTAFDVLPGAKPALARYAMGLDHV